VRRTFKMFLPQIIYSLGSRYYLRIKQNRRRSSLAGYENPKLVESIIRKTILAKQKIDNEKRIHLDAIRVFLPFALAKSKIKNVLELGGGAGYHYFNVATAGLAVEINWTILETPEFCKQAKKYQELDKINFINNLDSVKAQTHGGIDLVYCSRALQYFDDPLGIIKQIVTFNPKYIYLTGLTFSPDHEFHNHTQISELSSNGPQVEKTEIENSSVNYNLQLLPERMLEAELNERYSIELRLNEEPVVHIHREIEIPYKGIWAIRKDLK
jgi:putative methyltransferase (TIGR04325 family)